MTDAHDRHEFGEFGGEEPVVIRNRRRIDPETGDVRDPGRGASPFPGSTDPGDPNAAGQPISAQVIPGSEEVATLAAELADRTAHLQRLNAEYANYRKRMNRDLEAAATNAKAAAAGELLAVLDDIELAKTHGDLTGAFKAVAERLVGILEKQGLQAFGAEGDEFDPSHHEAVQFGTSTEVATPTVTSVFRRGYSFKDRPLRPAVVVVTGPEHEGDTAVSTPATGPAEDADAADREADAKARAEQESKQTTAPSLDEGGAEGQADGGAPAGKPAPTEDPA